MIAQFSFNINILFPANTAGVLSGQVYAILFISVNAPIATIAFNITVMSFFQLLMTF